MSGKTNGVYNVATLLKNELNRNYNNPVCFVPERDNPYLLCIGGGLLECESCQLRADWEPDDPYGVGA